MMRMSKRLDDLQVQVRVRTEEDLVVAARWLFRELEASLSAIYPLSNALLLFPPRLSPWLFLPVSEQRSHAVERTLDGEYH